MKFTLSIIGLFAIVAFSSKVFSQQIYSVPGTYTWVVPPCVEEITVKVWGGGGGGGGSASYQTGTGDQFEACSEGGGGGGGGFAMRTYSVNEGEVYTIVVGAGGNGGVGNSSNAVSGNGSDGQNSTFDGPAVIPFGTLTGEGGKLGGGAWSRNSSGWNHIGDNGNGGLGGYGQNGTTMFQGGSGSSGRHSASCHDVSGAGGGGAGSGGNGNDGSAPANCNQRMGGSGGPTEGGNGANGKQLSYSYLSTRQALDGDNGSEIGGGGSGSMIHLNSWANTWVRANGGKGGNGRVIIEYNVDANSPDQPSPIVGEVLVCEGYSGPYSVTSVTDVVYDWQYSGNGTITGSGNQINLENITTGGTLIVTPSLDCSDGPPQEIQITVVDLPQEPIITGDDILCIGEIGNYSVNQEPGVTYSWSYSGNGDIVGSGNTISLENVTSGGTITVIASNTCGDANPVDFIVTISDPPISPSPIVGSDLICDQNSNTYSVDDIPGVTFNWSYSGNGSIVGSGHEIILDNITSNGELTVTTTNSCGTSSSQTYQVVLNDVPEITSLDVVSPNCGTTVGSIVIQATGNNLTYSIDGGSTFSSNNEFLNLTPATYNIVVSDAAGCEVTGIAVINPPSDDLTIVIVTTDADCTGGGTATATVTGGSPQYIYNWSADAQVNINYISDLSGGNYSLEVTDDNGCSSIENFTISSSIDAPQFVTTSFENPSCANACDGEITVNVTSGAPPYTFNWVDDSGNTYPNQSGLTGLCGGSYTLEVVDVGGCIATTSFILTDPIATDPSFELVDFCIGEANAAINIATTGGTFSFNPAVTDGAIINASTGEILNGVEGTTYSVQYETPGSCPEISIETVSVKTSPNFSLNAVDPSCGNDDGIIIISGLTSSNPYELTYNQDGNIVGPNIVGTDDYGEIKIDDLGEGTYSNFEISDNDGCSSINDDIIILDSPDAPNVVAPADLEICLGDKVMLYVEPVGNQSVTWNNGVINGDEFTPTNTGSLTYTVTVSEGDCSDSDQITILVHDLPNIDAGVDQTVCIGENVTLTATGGDTYVWNTSETTSSISVSPQINTEYIVVGTDSNGCSNIDAVIVNVSPASQPTFIGDVLEGCSPLYVNFSNQNIGNNVTCLWNFGDGTSANGCDGTSHLFTSPGSYDVTLTVTTAEGCEASHTLEDYIHVYPNPIADFTAEPMELTTTDTHVDFFNNSENATQYQWDFADGYYSYDVNPSHDYPESESNYLVTLIAENDHGCSDTTSMIISIYEDLIFYVPNTFTPDNDMFNEIFTPVFTSGFDPFDFTLIIFNRWGEVVFESHDAMNGWDGTYGGKIAKDGTYVWKIEFATKYNDERKIYHGHVNLVR